MANTKSASEGKDTNPKDAIGAAKVPLSLCSPVAKAEWALAQFAGLTKYGAWNWRIAGVRASIYLDAIDRHADAYRSGEEFDPVDGTHHLGNIMACCAILLDAAAAGKLTDDRPPSVGIRETYARVEAQMPVLRRQYEDRHPRHYTIADTQPADEAALDAPVPYRLAVDVDSDAYCCVCDHDFCQCPQGSAERPLRAPVELTDEALAQDLEKVFTEDEAAAPCGAV